MNQLQRYAIAIGLPAFLVTIFVPLFYWSGYYTTPIYIAKVGVWQYPAFACLVLIALGSLKFPSLNKYSYWPYIFMAWSFVSLVWSINVTKTFVDDIAFLISFMAMRALWQVNLAWPVKLAEISIYVGLAMLAVYLGFDGRQIGGITPNMIGHLALTFLFFACLNSRVPKGALALAAFLIFFAQARTIFVSFTLFLILRYMVFPWFSKLQLRSLPVILAPLAGAFTYLLTTLLLSPLVTFLSATLEVQNKVRTSTDLTGRTKHWEIGARLFEQKPILGYGGFSRGAFSWQEVPDADVHSGVINLALDLGVIGVMLFTIWMITAAYWSSQVKGTQKLERIGLTCASFILAYIPTLVAEPNYISFYAPSSLAFLMALLMPCCLGRYISAPARRRAPGVLKDTARAQPSDYQAALDY